LSLRIKVFLFSVVLAILPLSVALLVVSFQQSDAGERTAREDLRVHSASAQELTRWSADRLRIAAALLATSPALCENPLEVSTAGDLQAAGDEALGEPLDIVALVRPDGTPQSVAASVDRSTVAGALQAAPVAGAQAGVAGDGLWLLEGRLFQVTAHPLPRQDATSDAPAPVLLLGRQLEAPFVGHDAVDHSRVALLADGVVLASSLDPRQEAQLAAHLASLPADTGERLHLDEEEYLVSRLPMPLDFGGERCELALLESLAATQQMRLRVLELFAALGLATLLGALAVAWAGAHRLTAPLRESAQRMEEMARTGELQTAPPVDAGPEVAAFQRTFDGLIESLRDSQEERERSYIETVGALVIAIDARDNDTTGHSFRVARYARCLGQRLDLKKEELRAVEWGALLHDIGKIAVPDAVLRKAGPLTEEEWHIMHQHPTWGVEMLADVSFLRPALGIVQYHQERWDGLGYPHGLAGDEIPIGARLFAVIDTYDAITSDRPYRRAASHEEAIVELRRVAGRQLDPELVEVFAGISEAQLSEVATVRRCG
jgi:putative nucleotidyltransferase with HDIG domain